MAVFRIEKTRDYTVMSNYHLRDMSLSLKAKGLLSLMLSLPENWDYTMKGLARICKDGIDSISGGIRELEAHGYLIRSRVRSANGQLGSIEYTILEQPKAPSPTQEKPIRENPVQANPMVSPDGMGLGPGGMYPGNRGGWPAAAGKVLLFFLPQYAGGGDHRSAGALPGFVPACAGIGG